MPYNLFHTLKKIMPKGLLGRFLVILLVPLLVLQIVAVYVFLKTHWEVVTRRLSSSIAGDIGSIILSMKDFPGETSREKIFYNASMMMNIQLFWEPNMILNRTGSSGAYARWSEDFLGYSLEGNLEKAMTTALNKPIFIDFKGVGRSILLRIQLDDGILDARISRKRLYSSTTLTYILWIIGTTLFMLGLSIAFMRIQIRAIQRLAIASDAFGKGRETGNFKPEGAAEVRQAGYAFLAMQKRIERQVTQRTEMLAGVSHDLRTPITRMKLQLAMMPRTKTAELQTDLLEMEKLIGAYLEFARGQDGEKPDRVSLTDIIKEIVSKSTINGATIQNKITTNIMFPLRPLAMSRCLSNLIENASRYAKTTSLSCLEHPEFIDIIIDDDGPGIPLDKREDVFHAFYRLENSRNQKTGGVGLGLAIARDIARSHGGDILLEDSPMGGLRVRLKLPY